MAKTFNPLSLSRPRRSVHVRTLADAQRPECSVTVAFRALDTVDQYKTHERAEELDAKYSGADATEFIVGEEVHKIPNTVWMSAAALETMQVEEDGADMLTAEEYAAICVGLPNLWVQLNAFVGQLQMSGGEVPNV